MRHTLINATVVLALLGMGSVSFAAEETTPQPETSPSPMATTAPAAGDDSAASTTSDVTGMAQSGNGEATATDNATPMTTPDTDSMAPSAGDTPPLKPQPPKATQPPPAKPAKKHAPYKPAAVDRSGMPVRGESMKDIEKRYGAPLKKLAPVGKPPITRWIYKDYTVYFEYQYVIDSVKNSTDGTPGAAPKLMEHSTSGKAKTAAPMAMPAAKQPTAPAKSDTPDTVSPPATNEDGPQGEPPSPAGDDGQAPATYAPDGVQGGESPPPAGDDGQAPVTDAPAEPD